MNRHFLSGMKASIPACFGVIPVGIAFGLLSLQAGLSEAETVLMSALVMAGGSQLMAVNMITQGAGLSAIVIGTFFINLRHVVMSSSAMQRVKGASLPQKLLAAFALCDESFALFSLSEDDSYPFLLGLNVALYVSFLLSTAFGSLITSVLPQIVIDSFGVAFYAALLGLLLPGVRGRSRLTALTALTALLHCLLGFVLPSSWSVIFAMILGALLGVFFVPDEAEGNEEKEEER